MTEAVSATAWLLGLALLLQTLELWLLPDVVRPARTLLVLQGVLAATLPLWESPVSPWLALASALCIARHFGGSFNGGSDAMTCVVLLGLALARSFPSSPLGLGYITAQLVLSYFVAGAWKLRNPRWRDGSALLDLLALPQYGAPHALRRHVAGYPRLASYGVIAFECAFPLALLEPRAALGLASVALVFHLANALVLGLNRFFWSWLAAYPALLWFSQR